MEDDLDQTTSMSRATPAMTHLPSLCLVLMLAVNTCGRRARHGQHVRVATAHGEPRVNALNSNFNSNSNSNDSSSSSSNNNVYA